MAHTKVTKNGTQNTGTANTFSYSGSFDVFKADEVEVELDNVMNQARSKAWAKITSPDHPGYASVQKLMSEKDGHTSRTRDNRNEILDLGNPRKTNNFPKN